MFPPPHTEQILGITQPTISNPSFLKMLDGTELSEVTELWTQGETELWLQPSVYSWWKPSRVEPWPKKGHSQSDTTISEKNVEP